MASGGDTLRTIYADHAATSWPKPPEVVAAVNRAVTELGGNPGRGAYRLALDTGRAVLEARQTCARLLGVPDARDLLFVPSCTFGCNLMLTGLLSPGDRVVVGGTEHNAVMRPLHALARAGVDVVRVPADDAGFVDPDDVERAVRERTTTAVVCQHVSNVTGAVQAIGDMSDIAHEAGALMLVDGAQGAGHLDVDIAALGVDAYAAAGHKGLLGPHGIGLLYLAPHIDPAPLVMGGTGGGSSALEEMPEERPDRYEAGTLNVVGALGVGAGAQLLLDRGAAVRAEETRLGRMLHEGLLGIPGVRVLGPTVEEPRIAVYTIVTDVLGGDRIAFELDRTYGIASRAGLHCAPAAHDALGSAEGGAVRLSLGFGNTEEDVNAILVAVAQIVSAA